MKYTHLGLMKNRSLLTTSPFSILNSLINKKIKEQKLKILDLQNEIKNLNINNSLQSNIVNFFDNNNLDMALEKIKSEELIFLKTIFEDNDLVIKETLDFQIINDFIFEKLNIKIRDIKTLRKLISNIEQYLLLKKSYNHLFLAEKYYNSGLMLPDKDLKFNSFYYFQLNISKTYAIFQFYNNKKINNNFISYFKEIHFNAKNTQSSKKVNQAVKILNLINYFKEKQHGLSFKEKGYEIEEPIAEVASIRKNENNNYLQYICAYAKSAFFDFVIAESDSITNCPSDFYDFFSSKGFNLNSIIGNIIEFQNLYDIFNIKNKCDYYNWLDKINEPIFINDSTVSFDIFHILKYINEDLNNLTENEIKKLIEKFISFPFKLNINENKINLIIDIKDLKTNKNINNNEFDIIQEIYNIFENEKFYFRNFYILTQQGYIYYLKRSLKNKNPIKGKNEHADYYAQNVYRYLFMFILSNEVRYYPNLILPNSEEHDKYVFLKEEAIDILPKQFLYNIVSKMKGKNCVIPYSNI